MHLFVNMPLVMDYGPDEGVGFPLKPALNLCYFDDPVRLEDPRGLQQEVLISTTLGGI